MNFQTRTEQSEKVIELANKYLWTHLKDKVVLCPYGYETHIPDKVQELLKQFYTKTSLHVRFTPDFLLLNLNNKATEPVILLEYKTITTPRYTLKDQQWNFGQVEADAWDNYLNLINAGIKVVVFIYCSYYCFPYLMDYPFKPAHEKRKVKKTQTGSGTDYYNIDLRRMKDLVTFLVKETNLSYHVVAPLVNKLIEVTLKEPVLQTKHDPKSTYKKYKTGFNWKFYQTGGKNAV